MSSDAANLPIPHPVPHRSGDLAAVDEQSSTRLRAEGILLAEFTHASLQAYQVNEDRTGLLNLYLLLMGVLVTAAGISVSYAVSAHVIGPILAVIVGLVLATAMSLGFFARLLHLSHKYEDALITMDVIKALYVKELKGLMPQLQQAIRWRLEGLSGLEGLGGTTFFIGSIIALTGAFCLGGASELLYFYTHAYGGMLRVPLFLGPIAISGIAVDAPVFMLGLLIFTTYYLRARRKSVTLARIAEVSANFDLK